MMLISSAIIAFAARGDLWLDEIWSVDFARMAASPFDIVHFHHDNNHVLNTFFLYFVRAQRTLYLYRLLAIACGIGSVILAGLIARQWGRLEALCAIILTGTSYPLVLYFSEARGYAPAMFFALLAYFILRRGSDRLPPALAFWITCILGTLSHLTFVIAIVAMAIGTLRKVMRSAIYCAPPLLFAAWWYAYFTRDLVFGRGPVYSTRDVIVQAATLALGLPAVPFLAIVSILLVVAAAALELYRHRDDQWLFFLMICLVAPAALLVVRPRYLYFRYLIVCFPFFYLLLSYLIGRISQRRWIAPLAIAILVSGHVGRDYALIRLGRGQYRAALAHIAASTSSDVLRVGSDDDVANGIVLKFYARYLPATKTLRYIPIDAAASEPPEWFLLHTQRVDEQPAPGLVLRGAGTYRFVARYPFGGISGWQWFLFRRLQMPAKPGSIRMKPSSTAQRSIAIERRSSIAGTGRASCVMSIDFT
jgi:hypothetical protein